MKVKGDSQELKFNHYCGLFITSFTFAFRDLNSGCNCALSLNLGQN